MIRCISTLTTDEKNVNDCATEPHEITHLPDALRYFCVMHQLSAREPDDRTAKEKQIADYKKKVFQNRRGGARIIY